MTTYFTSSHGRRNSSPSHSPHPLRVRTILFRRKAKQNKRIPRTQFAIRGSRSRPDREEGACVSTCRDATGAIAAGWWLGSGAGMRRANGAGPRGKGPTTKAARARGSSVAGLRNRLSGLGSGVTSRPPQRHVFFLGSWPCAAGLSLTTRPFVGRSGPRPREPVSWRVASTF